MNYTALILILFGQLAVGFVLRYVERDRLSLSRQGWLSQGWYVASSAIASAVMYVIGYHAAGNGWALATVGFIILLRSRLKQSRTIKRQWEEYLEETDASERHTDELRLLLFWAVFGCVAIVVVQILIHNGVF